jgi:GntR family transcriptional regulator/MocR family aminotransferase
MARRPAGRFIAWFHPDRGGNPAGLQEQLYGAIRRAVLAGELGPGERLPSSRALAVDLGLARNTVVAAIDRLVAEGYLESRRGAGVFIASDLPPEGNPQRQAHSPGLSRRAGAFPAVHAEGVLKTAPSLLAFGQPALDLFPIELWRRLSAQVLRRQPEAALGPGDARGLPELRVALARYLAETRGVVCTPETVVIVSGAQQALDLIGRLLLDPGDTAAVEDPGYIGAREALAGVGARLLPVPVDDQGFDPAAITAAPTTPKLAMLTPSHQFPLGMTLPLARRLALLNDARERGFWIVEDDYDCEFRYGSPPIQALQGLDGGSRVLYVGTFSKALFPGLRLGYVVLPPALVGDFLKLKATADGYAPGWSQAVLAAFIAGGHMAQHVRRMRTLYRRRRLALLEALDRHAGGPLRPRRSEAGLHLVAEFVDGRDDRMAAEKAVAAGIGAVPLSRYAIARQLSGLLLGFAATREEQIDRAVQRLVAALR